MSLLRPSIAGRLLRAGAPVSQRLVPASVRWESGSAIGIPLEVPETNPDKSRGASLAQSGGEPVRHNQPNYAAEVDQASS